MMRIVLFSMLFVSASVVRGDADQASYKPFYSGYLFVDGTYIEPPYDFEINGDSVSVGGEEFDAGDFKLPVDEFEQRRGPGGQGRFIRGGGGGRGFGMRGPGRGEGRPNVRANGRPVAEPAERLVKEIDMVRLGAMVVMYPEQTPLVLFPTRGGDDLLRALVDPATYETEPPSRLSESEAAIWSRFVAEFRPGEAFLTRAVAHLDAVNEAESAGDQVVSASLLMSKISYPLTVFAMVIVVLGFGHLLSNRPVLENGSGGDPSHHSKVVGQSLIIVALLSAVDLIWTITAHTSGSMRELNPLGSELISSTPALIAFKLMVTGGAIAILYSLHRRPVAQMASWWCCLLLTLLTARWVVFQSMFL